MPIWVVYHPETTFTTTESKQSLSQAITSIYADPPASLPAFYVTVYFIPISPNNTFIGGQPNVNPHTNKPFIRFVVDHIAITLPDSDGAYQRTTAMIDKALKPHVEDQGYDWEYHVSETERRLWKINGLAPPMWKSEGEAKWREEGRTVPLERGSG